MVLHEDQMSSFTLEKAATADPLRSLSPQQAATSAKGSGAREKRGSLHSGRPTGPLHPLGSLLSSPQGCKMRLRSVKAGLPSPVSSSGPFSRHLGDSPKFIDRQGSLESIWRTLLINLFQIIVENYWFA